MKIINNALVQTDDAVAGAGISWPAVWLPVPMVLHIWNPDHLDNLVISRYRISHGYRGIHRFWVVYFEIYQGYHGSLTPRFIMFYGDFLRLEHARILAP